MPPTKNFLLLTKKITREYYLDCFIILPFCFFIASQIIIPLPFLPVPISIQPLPILIAAWLLGRRGIAGYAIYLAQGSLGAPIFSGFSGGLTHILGPTGGYLIGFLFSAIIIHNLKKSSTTPLKIFGTYSIATAISFIAGVAHLASFMPIKSALACGFFPFIIGDFVLKAGFFVFFVSKKSLLMR